MKTLRDRCEQVVRAKLDAHAELQATADRLALTDDLYDHGLTSLAAARVMLAVEGELAIEFPEKWLGKALFSSIGRLTDACAELIGAQSDSMSVGAAK
ncbi:acyl carrier protein [Streptomyces sp. NBC_01537]|uniref:acyl carrier protein n=1 Tax=Streptomyces sp. NBC_01537 TaxID=2903896 RepID=UPI00386BE1C0